MTAYGNRGWASGITHYTSGGSVIGSESYDYEGRITQISYPGGSTNTFTYNGLDTRVGKVDSSGTETFKRDGVDVTSPLLSDGAANYTPGVSERRSGVSKLTYAGRMGTTQALTNGSQSVTDTRCYDASTGRFLTRDPAKDGRNCYVYCGNRPTVVVDDVGLGRPFRAWDCVGGYPGRCPGLNSPPRWGSGCGAT